MSRHIAATANRLRLIQIDFADEQPDVRRGYLSEAVEAALAEVLPEQREAFLKSLMARFPTWDPNVALRGPEEPVPTQSRTDERELQDPSFLVGRLVDMAPEIPPDQKRGLASQLQAAGLAPRARGGMPEEPLNRLREALGLKPDDELDASRILGLLATLADFVCSVDPLVWRTWGKLAPKSKFQSIASLRHTLSRFSTGDQGVGDVQAEEDLLKLRHLIASMVVALGQVGKIAATDVVSSFMTPLAPAKIEDLVKFEKGSIFVAQEVKCWRKYKELAGKLNDVAVEGGIREKVQRFVEELMKRRSSARH
jgi:hypothetical protein